jgi:flagellar basal body rod protein FlgG
MVRGIYTSAMGMQVQEMRQETISNNLANASTTGFKRKVTAFSADHWGNIGRLNDKFVKTPMGVRDTRPQVGFMRGGALLSETMTAFQEGNCFETGNALDLTLREPHTAHLTGETMQPAMHFFTVQNAQGDRFFTRNGEFKINEEGFLVTQDGNHFLVVRDPFNDNLEGPVKVNMHRPTTDREHMNSARDTRGVDSRTDIPFTHLAGMVHVNDQGFVELVDPEGDPTNPNAPQTRPIGWLVISRCPTAGLTQMGQNLFALTNDLLDPTDPDSTPRAVPVTLCTGDPTTPLVRSGVLESSTVSTVKEMVALLEANRVYEMNSRTLKAQDEMLGRTVSDVGRSVR